MLDHTMAMGIANTLREGQITGWTKSVEILLGLINGVKYDSVTDFVGIPALMRTTIGLNLALRFSPKLKRAADLCDNSFTEQTLVSTKDGLVPIENIKIGDKVWTYNESNNSKSLEEVTHIIKRSADKKLLDINLTKGEVITTTSNHPFWEQNGHNWILAESINSKSVLLNLYGENISIVNTKSYSKDTTVYNLTTANNHTFYVGTSEVLVHNCDIDEIMKKLVSKVPDKYCKNQKCDFFARDLEKKLKAKNIPYEKIELNTINGGPIGSDWYSPTQSNAPISLTGYHIGIKVGDKVYDNFNLKGVNETSWIADMYLMPGDKLRRK